MANFICEYCTKGFKRARAGNKKIRFCSQLCYHAWRKKYNIKTGCFKKGLIPWNKNKKGTHFSPATEFKKGLIPKNKLPIGSVTIRQIKKNSKRAFVKIADPNTWKLRCYCIWEKAYGPVPKGLLVHHQDRNTLNDNLTNLSLISRAAHINEHRSEFKKKRKKNADMAQKLRWNKPRT